MGEHNPDGTVPLGSYLWTRIHQLGVNHIFGVPGDFNLTLLDHIYNVKGLNWVGNTNELNAAYAADGYARVKNGAACVVTTHGVGELSALNGIAGSMTEQVKVIHVVGQTSRMMQQNHLMIHHSIGFNPDHQIFNKASRDFRVAAAELQSEKGAAEEIDRVLKECFHKSGPVYIYVPIDIVDLPVPAHALETPLDLEPFSDHKAVDGAARAILEKLSSSKNPAVFIDCLVQRHRAVTEARQLLDMLALPIYTSNMGKGLIDEANEHYVGIYNGIPSAPGIDDAFKKHDSVLVLGSLPADTNSGGFNRKIAPEIALDVRTHDVNVNGSQTFSNAPIKAVIVRLLALAPSATLPKAQNPKSSLPGWAKEADADSDKITQSWIWQRMGQWMEPHDVVLGETGTSAYGIPDGKFPAHLDWQTQTYYGSIGWATPAALGADLALHDLHTNGPAGRPRGRTLLFTGDGSIMLTVQEVGNMVKQGLAPVLFIINNAGYTIERVIHGARQSYNDIVPFNYEHMLPFLGNTSASQAAGSFHRATNKEELEVVLAKPEVKSPKSVQVVEIVMEMMDVPLVLATLIAMRGPESVKEMKEAGFKVPASVTEQKGFWN